VGCGGGRGEGGLLTGENEEGVLVGSSGMSWLASGSCDG